MSRPEPDDRMGVRSFNFLKRHFWYFTLPVLIFAFIYWLPNLATNLVNGVATTITRFFAGLLPAAGSLLFLAALVLVGLIIYKKLFRRHHIVVQIKKKE